MKFLYMTEVDLSIDNGPGINEREFITSLLQNHDQEVVCVTPYPQNPQNYHDCRIEYVISHSRYNLLRYFLFLIASFIKAVSLHSRYKFEAMVFRLGEIPILPVLLSNILGIPIILKTLAGYTLFNRQDRTWKHRLLSKIVLPCYRMSVRHAAAADTVSQTYIEWLHFMFTIDKEKVSFIPNGANTDFFLPGNRQESKRELNLNNFDAIVGYVGALDSLRHIDILINVASQINKKRKVGFIVVGSGIQIEKLRQIVQENGADEFVVFAGAIPYKNVPKYMAAFDIAVDLSLVPLNVRDGVSWASYSQKIAQYLSCGLPVVAWDIPDNEFLRRENLGGLATPGDTKSLLAEIEKALSLSEKHKNELSQRARKYAQEYLSVSKLTERRVHLWLLVAEKCKKRGQ